MHHQQHALASGSSSSSTPPHGYRPHPISLFLVAFVAFVITITFFGKPMNNEQDELVVMMMQENSHPRYAPPIITSAWKKLCSRVHQGSILVAQSHADNDLYQSANTHVSPNTLFNETKHGPSILSMYRWSQARNYSYLLFIAPLPCRGYDGNYSLVGYWCKTPQILYAYRIATTCGAQALLFVDSDVTAQYRFLDDDEKYSNHSNMYDPEVGVKGIWTVEDYLTSTSAGQHFNNRSADVIFFTDEGWWGGLLYTGHLYGSQAGRHDFSINTGGFLLRTGQHDVWNLLTKWWFRPLPLENEEKQRRVGMTPFEMWWSSVSCDFSIPAKECRKIIPATEKEFANKTREYECKLAFAFGMEDCDRVLYVKPYAERYSQSCLQPFRIHLYGAKSWQEWQDLKSICTPPRPKTTTASILPDSTSSSLISTFDAWPGDQDWLNFLISYERGRHPIASKLMIDSHFDLPTLITTAATKNSVLYHFTDAVETEPDRLSRYLWNDYCLAVDYNCIDYGEWNTNLAWQAVVSEVPMVSIPLRFQNMTTKSILSHVVDKGLFDMHNV